VLKVPEVHKDPEPLRALLEPSGHKGQEVPKEHWVVQELPEPKEFKVPGDHRELQVFKVFLVSLDFRVPMDPRVLREPRVLEVHKELKGHEVLKVHRVARVLWVTLEQGVPKGHRVVKDSKEHKVL
jgi:hypothetical protein